MNKHTEQEDATEVFYECDPEKATTCGKSCCFIYGGPCSMTMNPEWGIRKVRSDHGGRK